MHKEEENYLENRVGEKIRRYDLKGKQNQWWYRFLRISEIVFATSIPFFAGFSSYGTHLNFFLILIGLLGLMTAITAGVLNICDFQRNAFSYKSACELLKRERFLFLTGSGHYKKEYGFSLFVENVESIISNDIYRWRSQTGFLNEDEDEDDNGTGSSGPKRKPIK